MKFKVNLKILADPEKDCELRIMRAIPKWVEKIHDPNEKNDVAR